MVDRCTRQGVVQHLIEFESNVSKFARERAVEEVYICRQPKHHVGTDRLELYDFIQSTIGNVPLIYLEFGVFRAGSIAQIARRFSNEAARFFGFDSFTGLPEQWKAMPAGTFSLKGRLPDVEDGRIKLIKGWFQDTVPEFLRSLQRAEDVPLLIHFDADLYSSTLFLLSSLWHYQDEYYFIFDEFMADEIVALRDFVSSYPVEFEFICQTNGEGYPAQIFGRLRRARFEERTRLDSIASQE